MKKSKIKLPTQSKNPAQNWSMARFLDGYWYSAPCRSPDFNVASTRVSWAAGLSLLVAAGGLNAEQMEFKPSLEIIGFADTAIEGDTSSDFRFSGYIEGFLTVNNIWSGGSVKAQLEYSGGDDFIGLGEAGVVWPTNTYSAAPRALSDDDPEWSLWVTHEFNESHSLGLGKWNVFELAEHNPVVGGQGKGGFQYLGINTPGTFLFPPYFFGAQYSYKSEPVNYSLFVYDTQVTAGDGYWDNLFDDGVIFNGTATYKAKPGGLPGFYSLNLNWSTQKVVDYTSVPNTFDPPGTPVSDFIETTDGEGFAAIKFQQYLSYDPDKPSEGWGVFGEVGLGTDGNPLDALAVLGVAGTSPIAGRGDDRWGLAWARYYWNNGMIRLIEAEGGEFQDEWGAEAFYEAKITDIFRIGANVVYVRPGVPSDEDVLQFGLRFRATFQ